MAERRDRPAPLEWLAAAVGLAIFAALFGTIFWQGSNTEPSIPDLAIEHQRIVPTHGGIHVLFDVHNRSSRTAAAVVVEGRLTAGSGQSESSQVTIDYVPARSRVAAALLFGEEARGREIQVRAVGYREP